jgi:hypothetical protein
MKHLEIIYGLTGQSFFYDPPEGRPSGTPTVQVFSTDTDDDGTAESATTGACSVDTVSTTISAAASAGAVTLTLTSGTGVTKHRRYLLTDADGNQEWVEVLGVNGTAIRIRQPLINDYASGATFVGCRISISVDSTWVADETNLTDTLESGAAGYRLRWSYTVDSIATIGVSYADLVRYQAKNLVTPLDVDRTFPGWLDRLSTDNREDQGRALVDEAFRSVKMDALADAQLLRRIRDTQVLSELVIYRANLLAVQNNVIANGLPIESLGVARDLYQQRYVSLIREPKVSVDQAGGGSNGTGRRMPAWKR